MGSHLPPGGTFSMLDATSDGRFSPGTCRRQVEITGISAGG